MRDRSIASAGEAGAREAGAREAGAREEPPTLTGSLKKHPPITIGEHTQIDRFGLIRELAHGGMGQVFLARDTKLGRKVAIKFLLHNDPNIAQRFLVEARATARCTHENIVAIYEVGEFQGLPYMVLEYLEGKTLSKVLEAKPGTRQFAEIMLAVARGLERAHEHGIVHRDLKPSNIFVTDRGQVKVLDFGVARVFDLPDQLPEPTKTGRPDTAEDTYVTFTGGGTLVGTLPYMSPEQWGADVVDHQSDLWAIGIMFWRALTGVHPAGTMNAERLRERLRELDTPLPSIGSRDPTLPRELVAIVDRCLRKHKRERYANATELIADLHAFLAPTSQIAADTCPYRGLASFGEADARFFFGRTNEIRTALSQLETWPLLAVIGPSGVGKSSFVHAGLVPALRATGGDWQVRVLRPGRAPLHSLAATLDDEDDIVDQLRDAPGLYGELLRETARKKKQRALIVVDQLEELFTLSDDAVAREIFLAALLGAADDPSAPVRVVLSMRADFLDRLAGYKHVLDELSRGLFFLSAPDAESLKETIVRPAELAGYAFEDAAIVDDMLQAATSRGALPLVQFAATRLWDARDRARRRLTAAAYNAMGGVGGAFARHADEVIAAVPPQSQGLLRAIMTRLVTPEGTRAVVDVDELHGLAAGHAGFGDDRRDVQRVLDQLVRARLVLLHADPAHGSTVEIVHEVLITEWPTLARWLEDSQALRGFLAELRTAVKQWLARGKPADLVWRGQTAQEALALVHRHVVELSAAEKEFLDAARRELARVRRRRVGVVGAVFLVLAIVIAGGAYFTIQLSQANSAAQDKAREAEAAQAKAQAQLDAVRAADAAKVKAEADARAKDAEAKAKAAEASRANEAVAQSQEDLQKKNVELQKALADAQNEKAAVQKYATAAQKAADEAKAAKAKAEALLAKEQVRVKQLEAEKAKIATGGLK